MEEKNGETIYLAGPFSTAPERCHNLLLGQQLEILGYEVILPQREALQFTTHEIPDREKTVTHCKKYCKDPNIIFVGNIDGQNDGVDVEFDIATEIKKIVIIYRTNLRTAPGQEVGVNAMFMIKKTPLIYSPCFCTKLEEVDEYYRQLAGRIHREIKVCRTLST